MAVNTWAVAAGQLIESAWGNTVRQDLLGHESRLNALELDSGNVAITPSPSFPSGTFVCKKVGRLVELTCVLTKDSNASSGTTFLLGTLPVSLRPVTSMGTVGVTGNPSGGTCHVTITASGQITAINLTIAANGSINIHETWLTAA